MLEHDDSTAPAALFAVDLTLAADATAGRARLRIVFRGKAPMTLAVPDRVDQVEWFDPETRTLRAPTPLRSTASAGRVRSRAAGAHAHG